MKRAAECQRKDGQYEAPEVALVKHLKDKHRELFRRECGEECVKTDRAPAGKYLAFLNQAQQYSDPRRYAYCRRGHRQAHRHILAQRSRQRRGALPYVFRLQRTHAAREILYASQKPEIHRRD